jgi:hypothetical protein
VLLYCTVKKCTVPLPNQNFYIKTLGPVINRHFTNTVNFLQSKIKLPKGAEKNIKNFQTCCKHRLSFQIEILRKTFYSVYFLRSIKVSHLDFHLNNVKLLTVYTVFPVFPHLIKVKNFNCGLYFLIF